MNPLHVRRADLRHYVADEFAQCACLADFGLDESSGAITRLYTLAYRREVTSSDDVSSMSHKGRYLAEADSVWP